MSLCWAATCQHKSSTEKLGLCFANLFLWFKNSIDKFLVRQLATEMTLGDFV